MFDYNIIKYILRKKNFSLYLVNDDEIDIIKNENGTYGEFNDFIINIKINKYTNKVLSWKVILPNKNEMYLMEINKILTSFVKNEENILFEDLCIKISENL